MKVLILSFSSNKVNEDSFIPNKIGLTFLCVEECEKQLKKLKYEYEHICINEKNIRKCIACGERGWGICLNEHICIQKDDFNDIYKYMGNFDAYIFVTPVYFHEMSESAKTFFDRLKRCDAFNDDSKIKGKKIVCIACAGGSGSGTEETLKAFDSLNYFLGTEMYARIPVTKANFESQKEIIYNAMNMEDKYTGEYENYLAFAKDIAKEAGKIMKKYFEIKDISSYKGDKTIVTLADKEINSYLIKRVKEQFPNHCVDGEEEQFGESSYTWVCDPVDGTAMYARSIPVAVFSLALVIDGIPVVGVIYDPFTNNLYTAIKGQGAYQNNKKINVNDYTLEDMKSVSHFDSWPSAEYDISKVLQELGKRTYFVGLGSIIRACTCVASGEFILAIFPGTKHKNCDIAAAKVIVEEAGGKVTDLFGDEQRYDKSIKGAIISNGKVHNEVIETIKKYL